MARDAPSERHCQIIPPYLLERLAEAPDPRLAGCGRRTLELDSRIRSTRQGTGPIATATEGDAAWLVHTAANTTTLPGELVRSAGEPESGDLAVDEAGTGLDATLALLADLGRSSYDGDGATAIATVHYGTDYDNAFWDGTQLVFGDGDGEIFDRFTKPIDVLGHELAHALTQHTANLTYQGQPGALNESVSDVIGACVKQRVLGQDAASADWLIGEGIFLPGVNGRALRSMAEPGTAYDDPRLGKDPQGSTMADYIETEDDNGGVHLNSGIPNRAFHLAATTIGGSSWEGAGRIWFAALTSGIAPDTDFAGFAQATIEAAGEHAELVRDAWQQVGVLDSSTRSTPAPPTAAGVLIVRRSGGFAGQVVEGRLDLSSEDARAEEARALLARVDLRSLTSGTPRPDRFVYVVECPPQRVTVQEPDLTPDLQRLVALVLQ